jgi:hypothetical protein
MKNNFSIFEVIIENTAIVTNQGNKDGDLKVNLRTKFPIAYKRDIEAENKY